VRGPQFAFTIIWHIIFPAFTIGLSAYVATLCVMWMRTGKEHYRELARFWTKIFAAAFAMGVVSGLVLTYQFGTNWGRFSAVLGNVVGPMIGYEVEVAFFLEATFLGVLLFGWDRMPPAAHAVGRRRCGRHIDVSVLDPVGQQLDANACRIRNARRPVATELSRRNERREVPLGDITRSPRRREQAQSPERR
jgi:hypothetical protein